MHGLAQVFFLTRFQPFLRFNIFQRRYIEIEVYEVQFQPFLRFNGSCVRFLLVFKFFFGFCLLGGWLAALLYIHFIRRWVKSMRRSSALRENEDEKKAGKVRHSSQCRAPGLGAYVEFINRPVQLTASASHTYWTSPLSRNAYTASLTAARYVSVPGVGGATAPISANSLRRVRSRVRRSKPHCRGLRQADSGGLQEGAGENEGAAPPPPPDPAEELLKEWPELQAFGVD